MPGNEMWVAEGAPAATASAIDVVERPSIDKFTTTTADPGTGGTTLAVTANAKFPPTNNYRVRVVGTSGVPEIMLVTAGAGTNSWTVTRGQDGTTGVAHSVGATVSLMVGVQRVELTDATRIVTYKGRVTSFRTPGRAGTTGQKILAIHNATASTVLVDVEKVKVDMATSVAIGKVGTIIPPIVRLCRFTAVPTNGTAGSKVPEDSALASNSAVTVWADSSADGTASGTTLTVTIPAGNIIDEKYPDWRVFGTTGTGTNPYYETHDQTKFLILDDEFITLRALEGLVVFLDYTVATANPVTDFWLATLRWTEYRII